MSDPTWTAPAVERVEPALVLPEREALEARLDFLRETLVWKCAGLTGEQLAERAVPPSSISLLGLVRHMTEVERWWFRIHAGDRDMDFPYATEVSHDAAFEDVDPLQAEDDLRVYLAEVELARQVAAGRELDDQLRSHGHHPDRVRDLRWIYVHMIEEYARHCGHADLLRERLDGATGE